MEQYYISGDVGQAVFEFAEIVQPSDVSTYDLDYLCGKLVSHSWNHDIFDPEMATKRIREWFYNQPASEIEYVSQDMERFQVIM
ncbi:hypothetical protein [Thermoactinomyces sp. DSM 45891]|uniref:hypothetical protein n=1 Tax=Thermoactinomyces sp. DSM 45891 TaxID=1761907 RepID=UPI00093166A9|nr:hypothetical protein [Thermoactinomyces sp. DSM 45891]